MKKALYYLIIAALCISVFNFCVSAVDIETPGEYTGESDASATANQTAVDMSDGYKKIILDVPFYSQGTYYYAGDCGISSIAMVEAYKKGYDSNDITVYNAVYNYNGSTFLESYSALGYSTIDKNLSAIYEQLQHDNPVIVYRTGNGRDHYSVVYGYNGSSTNLEAKGFLVWNTYYTDGTMIGPGTVGYSNLETWLSGSTWTHAMIRVGNAIPLADKTGTAMFNQIWADNITAANAQIYARIPYQWITDCGFYIGTSESNMTKYAEKDNLGSGVNIEYIYYTLSDYTSLAANTKYYYKIYFVSGGTTYQSKTYCFYTGIMPNEGEEQALIASGTCGADGDNLTWKLSEDGTLTISGTGKMMDWTTMGNPDNAPWYPNRSYIAKVVMESGITFIGGKAFADCVNLVSITIPEGVSGIGINAFLGCDKLVSITLPESLIYIKTLAFQGCDSLTSITIPANVYTVAGEVFPGCDSLTDIHVDSDNSNYCDVNGVLFNKSKTVLHTYPAGKNAAAYVIPQSVETIGKFAFQYCTNLTSVIIPKSVATIETYGFSGCPNLTIYGYAGSTAETYAKERGIPFKVIRTTVAGVTLDKSSVTIDVGDILNLTATVSPAEATDKTVFWTSSNPSVASVSDGAVTAKSAGTTTITVTTVDGSKTATCVVTVNEVNEDMPSLKINDITVRPGESFYVDIVAENCGSVKAITVNDIEYSQSLTLTNAEWLLTGSTLSSIDINGDSLIAFQSAVDANKAVMRLYFTVDSGATDEDAYIHYKALGTDSSNKNFDFVEYDGTVTIRSFIIGDCDGDEVITVDDAIYLAFYTFYPDRYPIPEGMNVDFDKDGEVTVDDAIYLAFYTFYPDRYPLN